MPSSPVTRASLITRVNQRANTSGYVEQTQELPQLIDTSLGKLYNIFAAELYEDYFEEKAYIQLVTNQDTYQLPAHFMKPRAVFYLNPIAGQPIEQSGRWPMKRMDPSEELSIATTGSYPNQPYGYVIKANTITVLPRPGGAGTFNPILLYYIPEYVPPLNDNTPISYAFAFGWDEWVVNDVVVQIRNKAMMPVTEIVKERDAFMERVYTQAKNRNALEPPRVRNTGWRYGNGYPPWGSFSFR